LLKKEAVSNGTDSVNPRQGRMFIKGGLNKGEDGGELVNKRRLGVTATGGLGNVGISVSARKTSEGLRDGSLEKTGSEG